MFLTNYPVEIWNIDTPKALFRSNGTHRQTQSSKCKVCPLTFKIQVRFTYSASVKKSN